MTKLDHKPLRRKTRVSKINRDANKPREKSPLHPDFDGEIVPKPAFRKFELEDEWHGRRRLRGFSKFIDEAKSAPNCVHEIFQAYREALSRAEKFTGYLNQAGKLILREKRKAVSPEQAAKDLFTVAKNATYMLSRLVEKQPELCREIAVTSPEWPVMADLTEKNWLTPIRDVIEGIELGKDIKGFLLSARTADENVIRCWATAIYETLFQTRFDYKRAKSGKNRYSTTKGCPEWVAKTLELPQFTKATSGAWARIGRQMLLEQCPDFLESPDLVEKRRSWEHRAKNDSRTGRVTIKAIQREAFDDFAKDMRAIAPEKDIYQGNW